MNNRCLSQGSLLRGKMISSLMYLRNILNRWKMNVGGREMCKSWRLLGEPLVSYILYVCVIEDICGFFCGFDGKGSDFN